MSTEKIEWKAGWGRHFLLTIEKAVCKDCLVGFICDVACLNYRTVNGAMIAWSTGCQYDVTEEEFRLRLSEAMELVE